MAADNSGMTDRSRCFRKGAYAMNSRNRLSISCGLTTIRKLQCMLCPPLQSAVLLIELCQASMAQHEALELGREEPVPTLAHWRGEAFSERPLLRWDLDC